MKFIIVSILLCTLLAFSTVSASKDSIHIELFSESTPNKIAIFLENESVDTIAVIMQDSSAEARSVAMHDDNGFWVALSEEEPFVFPLSFTLTSADKQELSISNIITLESEVVDTGVQYAPVEGHAPRRHRPSWTTTTTRRPSVTTTTTTTTRRPSSGTTTTTTTTTTRKPSSSTTTTTTRTPSSSTGGIGIMVALYTYPGSTWTTVAQNAGKVKTVAIINPSSGPGNGPDSTYKTYMTTMKNAGVEMIGYVHTSYGARAWSAVKADIDKYASEFPLVNGIFIDEASASSAQVAYYTQVHNYIMSMPGYKYNVLNPGTTPVQAYYSISTQIVSYESAASGFASSSCPSYANSGNKDHFSMISHSASASQMQTAITAAKSKGCYGWVYVTDGAASGGTYNSLPSYYAQQVALIASL